MRVYNNTRVTHGDGSSVLLGVNPRNSTEEPSPCVIPRASFRQEKKNSCEISFINAL